ncbi:ATP-binding protein [Succinivibrio dextrinosolvens]|uniref:ATP-binding protein n=1 Tax=Succinivibrio dextrinosolvens TaxID=83771 RepID=UPI0004E217AF|nr:AAA family ATPase [Succinivibrio dextrinosolvens]
MEIKRSIYNKIADWKKQTNGSKALLIEGARRIGKSTVAEKFAKNEYKSYILIDFNKAGKKVKDAFNSLDNLDVFFQTQTLEYNTRLYPRESLIIFDEVQKFPKAREAIKYLVADGRYDYIETGSLISIKENVQDITIPSEERKLQMYPVTFDEFMVFMDEEILLDYIKECFKNRQPLDRDMHNKALRIFKEYMLVGGMPQSIVAYKKNGRDFHAADVEKRDILSLYEDDIKKAAKRYQSKVSAIFDNIPGFLSTHEKRIVLKEIESNGTFDRYDEPLFWLGDSMICNLCYKCNDPNVGLALNRNDSYVKCYMGDTGLLVSHAFSENEITDEQLYKQIMDGKLSLNQGMLYENVISQIITASGRKLYFYTRYSESKHRNDIEIDFLISNESKTKFKISPIEVKSSKNYTTSSLIAFKEIFNKRIDKQIIVHPKNYSEEDGVIKIPPYMMFLLL